MPLNPPRQIEGLMKECITDALHSGRASDHPHPGPGLRDQGAQFILHHFAVQLDRFRQRYGGTIDRLLARFHPRPCHRKPS
jgi:hypothetical protein